MTQVGKESAYQVLFDGRALQGEVTWPLPTAGAPGDWVEVTEFDLIARPAAHFRQGAQLFLVEYVEEAGSLKARLARQVPGKELASLGIFTTGTHHFESGVYACCGDAVIESEGDAVVYASGKAHVKARGWGKVYGLDQVRVESYERVHVEVREQARVHAHGNGSVVARAFATVFAHDQVKVEGFDGAIIRGFKNANITAHGTCKVYTFDTAKAWLHDKVVAYADGTSIIRAAESVQVIRKSMFVHVQPLIAA